MEGHDALADMIVEREAKSRGLSERESLPLAFFLDWSSAFDSGLLLLQFEPLALQLFLHLSVSCVKLFLTLLQFRLLFCHLLLEDHLHFGLHLGKLLLVERTLFLLLHCRVDLLEDAGVLGDTHLNELVCSVVLVEVVVGVLLELFHVCANEHLSEFHEVAVLLVVDLDDTPRVLTTAHLTAIGVCDLIVRTNNGERDLGHYLLVLGDGLFVIKLVARTLENLDIVVLDVCQNLQIIRMLRDLTVQICYLLSP